MSELKVTTLKHADSAVDSIVMASDGTLAFGAAVTDSAGVAIQGGGAAQAWVNFNGTGTVAIRKAFNVSSITDRGTGLYTVNFTNAMSDTNYAIVGMADDSGSYGGVFNTNTSTYATTSVGVFYAQNNSPGLVDFQVASVAIFS